MARDFINDKVTEMITAADSGNDQALAAAFNEALRENDGSVEQTLAAMTKAAQQQRSA